MPAASSPVSPVPILPVSKNRLKGWLAGQPAATRQWVAASGFAAAPGSVCLLPGRNGGVAKALAGIEEPLGIWSLAHLPALLPRGTYAVEGTPDKATATQVTLGWRLASYAYTAFKKPGKNFPRLHPPASCDTAYVARMTEAVTLARDLINAPANVMGPEALAEACKALAAKHKAECRVIAGEALLKENYPAIHAVGRACAQSPRLADIRWGNARHPKVTLVGKGVTFDTGGLDLKSASNMLLMKKDMGGVACALGLAHMIMAGKLPVRLRVLAPIVENSVSGNAYRPSDIIGTRKGISVEVGNTDAEGRLILCDALAEADSETPDLLIDMATLTGASRVALGADIPSFFTGDDALAAEVALHAAISSDPLWRLPLWQPYREILNSPVADINSAPEHGYAGAITAALFLKEFVTRTRSWMHIDMMAWNLKDRPGRPMGGEAQGLRALYALLAARYGKK